MTDLTIGALFDAVGKHLKLQWIAGEASRTLIVESQPEGRAQPLVGSLNLIHPNRIQLIGEAEMAYLDAALPNTRQDAIDQLFAAQPLAVIFTDSIGMPDDIHQASLDKQTPLFSTSTSDQLVASHLSYYLSQVLAERDTIHGVFMEVFGTGVLLTGMAAVGKSELALELITRGHRLIADDAPEFARIAPDIVSGSCPPLLQDFIEVRGLGLLNVRRMFGDTAIKRGKYLRLIIHIAQMDHDSLARLDRLTGTYSTRNVLGLEIPKVTVPLAPGRNMAIIVETAVRQYMLRQQDYEASEDFIARQRRAIDGLLSDE